MGGIFGIIHRDGSPIAEIERRRLRFAAHRAGCDDEYLDSRTASCLLIGSRLQYPQNAAEITFAAAGRLRNRTELARSLGLETASAPTDAALMRLAYLRWGEAAPERIVGDWSLAAWDPEMRKLFLARDHCGHTALYYFADARTFAFASSRSALLALNLAAIELDELYLAQLLISWPAYHGERTINTPLKRLPPAHRLTVTPDRLETSRYWRLEDVAELHLPTRQDYVDAFRDVFDRAVRECLPTEGKVAVSLSGGLDSGAVTATAALILGGQGRRLMAFTSVPLSETERYVGERFGDELPFARATAEAAGNVDINLVDAAGTSPINAIRDGLDLAHEPQHAAANLFWLLELYRRAARNCGVMLTGQQGNAGISWTGDVFSQSLALQWQKLGPHRWLKEKVKRALPEPALRLIRRYRSVESWTHTAIHPAFASRLDLWERRRNDPFEAALAPRQRRFNILLPGRNIVGVFHAELGAGLDVRDPTADPRVLAFCLSVPDRIFIDPETGTDRWLIREAMKGRMPDAVRLNRRRGRQAGDLVPRLRAATAEVKTALDEISRGPAAEYLDVPHMRRTWTKIQTEDSPDSFRLAGTVLLRGIMAGLFVNGFGKTW